jgi:hypothetical protein
MFMNTSLNKLVRIGVALLLIAIPLYPKFPLINVTDTYVAIRLEDFLIAAVAGLWLIRRAKFKANDPLQCSILLFWIVGLVSLASAIFLTQSVIPHIGMLHTLRRVEYMVVFFIVWSTIKSKEDVRFYVEVILLTAFLVFVYAIGQKFLQWPIISTMNSEYSKGIALNIISGGRINSTFAGHYDLAAYTVLMINLLAALAVGVKKWTFRLWVILVSVGVFWMLLMSASRISFAAYLGSITVTLWLLEKKLWIIPVVTVSLLFSSLAPSLFSRYSEVIEYEFAPRFASLNQIWQIGKATKLPQVAQTIPTPTPTRLLTPGAMGIIPPAGRIQSPEPTITPTPGPRQPRYTGKEVFIPEDRSTAIRFNAEWPRALRAFKKNLLLGTGYSSITLATDNDYLRLLGEVGLIGFASFCLIFIIAFNRIKSQLFSKKKDFNQILVIGITGGMLGFIANAIFIDVFEASKVAIYFWMLLGLMIGTSELKH